MPNQQFPNEYDAGIMVSPNMVMMMDWICMMMRMNCQLLFQMPQDKQMMFPIQTYAMLTCVLEELCNAYENATNEEKEDMKE